MSRKLILFLPLLLLLAAGAASAQTSSKSKSKERFREKDERRFPVSIDNIRDLNQKGRDFGPAYYKDGVVFVSGRGERGPRDERTGDPFMEHYYSTADRLGKLIPPSRFLFNEDKKSNFHEGPVTFTRDFKTAFVTRVNNKDGIIKANKSGRSTYKIYEMHEGFPDWTKPIDLPFNSENYSCMQPSLSPDGTKLFFASDMPGGQGGYDLYVVDRFKGGTWGAPVNLGPAINTDKNELFPFISYQGTLFFTSNGHEKNLGGMDIFMVNNPLTNPEEIVNLGDKFNSPEDDLSFVIAPDGKSGYFCSDRKADSYGREDIFSFDAPNGLEGIGKPEVNFARFNVRDAKTGEPLQGAEIRILQPSDDGFISGKNDFYTFDLLPVQDKPNAFSLQIVRKGAEDLGDADLYANADGSATTEFNRFRSYLVLVSADGYTPRERLISVEDEKDINLDFKMAEQPVCMRSGGIVLTMEFGTRIANASIRFVHKESGHAENVRTNLNGEFDACLPLEGDYVAYVKREGFKDENYTYSAFKGRKGYEEVRLRPLKESASVEETMPLANGIYEGSVIVMDKIFYEYNKATLNQGAIRHLDALLEMMKNYPEMEIDLIAHTDTRGETRLNQELTDERSKNAKTYLVYKGIEDRRIRAIGKGESEPRNHCTEGVECTDDEHQENNRLEVKVRKLGKPVTRP
jgi:outer membrane protein OmpA-like peptidoglycan-associated protein